MSSALGQTERGALFRERARIKKNAEIAQLRKELEQVKQERDALLESKRSREFLSRECANCLIMSGETDHEFGF